MNAWLNVKKNKGSGGVDGVSLENFENKLKGNLYKLWNRMSSGSYFPQAVRRVEIPKSDGRMRPLGIPTVSDRIAQEVVRAKLEPIFEPKFHKDSYGFRRGKSAHQAVDLCRQRNFEYDWTIDLDIKSYFDTIDHELLMLALEKHVPESWMTLYIKRWINAEVELPDGSRIKPSAGTPQGGVISPLLANIFLHYVFDKWIAMNHNLVKFERYADDVIIHCRTQEEAGKVLESCIKRFNECKLMLHPDKTHVVYNKDTFRKKENYPIISYTFLGFEYRARPFKSLKNGKIYTRFNPSATNKAKKSVRWKLKEKLSSHTTNQTLESVAESINMSLRGWLNYFNPFSTLRDLSYTSLYIKLRFTNWLQRKFRLPRRKAHRLLERILLANPEFIVLPKPCSSYGWIGRAV
jgi:group II intron reverse transcriptase/maturase